MGSNGETPLAVFLHIPHAAGTTFETILRDNFPGGVRRIGNAFMPAGGFNPRPIRRVGEVAALARDAQVLIGRLPFAVRGRLPPDARYVTFVRDPIERTLSQYYYLLAAPGKVLPGDGSLEATLAAGDVIYDNLQTRMLSDDADPVGAVDERMLEQAMENLRSGFTTFGIVERFDESLVLLAQRLGLESILYVRERFAERPRGVGVPADMLRAARRFNRRDLDLYRFAVELFERRVAEQGAEFHIELAALRAARDGEVMDRPPVATPDELWALLVGARADVMRDRRERASAETTEAEEVRALLEQVHERVGELSSQLTGTATASAGAERTAGATQLASSRAQAVATRVAALEEARDDARRELDKIKKQARSIDESASDDARLEAEGLRGEATRAERRLEAIERRVLRARAKLDDATAAEETESMPLLEPPSPDVFAQRAMFFDAAEAYTELVSADVGSARFLVRTRDKHIGRSLFLKQGRGDMKLLHRCVTTVIALLGEDAIAGRLLIDVGANIGSTAIHGLQDGPFEHVVAIEPDPENFETLRLNVLLNGLEARATTIQAAASNAVGELPLVVDPTRSGKHWIATEEDQLRKAAAGESSIAVPAVTLDSLAAEGVYDPDEVGLLWIDAEHHEGHILIGATELTDRGVPVVFEWDPVGLDEAGGRRLISGALMGRYTHFVDMRATYVPGEPKYRLRPINELAAHVHPATDAETEHFTEILALRLSPEQVPEEELLAILRSRGRQTRRRDVAAGHEASPGEGDSG
jgi:FkbM family methyltransferase